MIKEVNNLIIDSVIWGSQMGVPSTLGFVLCHDKFTGEKKVYYGTGYGFNEEADIIHIAAHGAKLHPFQIETLLEHFEQETNENND